MFPWSAAFVKNLVREVDRELYSFFDKSDCRDYIPLLSQVSGSIMVCHAWEISEGCSFEYNTRLPLYSI